MTLDPYQVLYHRGFKNIIVDNEVLLTVIAPAMGAAIGSTVTIVNIYRQKRRKKKTDTVNHPNCNGKPGIFYPLTTTLVGRQILLVYGKVTSIYYLNILVSSCYKIINGIIIVRSVILVKDLLKYYLSTRENLVEVAINSLAWTIYSPKRDKIVSLAFTTIVFATARLWYVSSHYRKVSRIWIFITFLNLAGAIRVHDDVIKQRPSDMGIFGLPPIERLIQQSNSFAENASNSRINMLEKEDKVVLSSTLQNEMPDDISKNGELEINKIIQNSILGEETILLPKKEGLQKGETSRTNVTSKPKQKTNSLQELNKTSDNVTPFNVEENRETLSNSTKIKAEKVQ